MKMILTNCTFVLWPLFSAVCNVLIAGNPREVQHFAKCFESVTSICYASNALGLRICMLSEAKKMVCPGL